MSDRVTGLTFFVFPPLQLAAAESLHFYYGPYEPYSQLQSLTGHNCHSRFRFTTLYHSVERIYMLPPRPGGALGTWLRILTINDVYSLGNYPRVASAVRLAREKAAKEDCVVVSTLVMQT